MKHTFALFALTAAVALTGCAVNRTVVTTYDKETGKKTGKAAQLGWTLGDGQAALAKARLQLEKSGSTNNTFAPGITLSGVAETSSSTNATQAAGEILGTALKALVK